MIGNICTVCKKQDYCPFTELEPRRCSKLELKDGIIKVDSNLYDEEEIHENCTVQILRNSVTGETSIGWYENK